MHLVLRVLHLSVLLWVVLWLMMVLGSLGKLMLTLMIFLWRRSLLM